MIIIPGRKPETMNLETSGGRLNLQLIKDELDQVQTAADPYFNRLSCALDWWQSRWEGQTIDGRKWWRLEDEGDVFPWRGASDTRTRLVKKLVNEYRTISLYGLNNMRVQAKSVRPAASARQSQQATTLINWQIFTLLAEEWARETELAIVWAGGFGSSVISVDWEQVRRLDYTDINTVQFGLWISKTVGQQFSQDQVNDMLESPGYEDDILTLIQALSEIVTKTKARSILRDLREMRHAEIPVPYVYKSQPRVMALRPFVDCFFPVVTDDLQRARFFDRVEYMTETEMTDRIETDNWDPAFVAEAILHKGEFTARAGYDELLSRGGYGVNGFGTYPNIIRPGGYSVDGERQSALIEVHHFYNYGIDYGVPCLFRTVFHPKVDFEATHGPNEYNHGQMPFHALRFETDQRAIMSSQGIPEIAYTWEQEDKTQVDFRTDRTSIAAKPPMMAPHSDILKIKNCYVPNGQIPTSPGREFGFAPIPPLDPGSVEISREVLARAREYFGWFGADVDPQLKQMRQMETTDRVVRQLRPVVRQMFMLDQQYLPDDEVAMYVGNLARPFHLNRADIQAQHEISMTCDPRELDNNFLKNKFAAIAQILPWDKAGVIDMTAIITNALESIDYTLADMAIRSPESVTGKEIEDEMTKVSLIIGSGIEQPLPPQGSNFQLRLQTMQNLLNSTPGIKQRFAQDPATLKVLENRYLYLTRQIQQQTNATLGKTQVGSAFNHLQPPMIASQPAGLLGQ